MGLENKVIVITGASSGIGKATAVAAAQRKARVVLVARREERLRTLADGLSPYALAIRADVSQEEDVRRVVQTTLDHLGRIDVWINNAGVGFYGTIEETTPEAMNRLWQTNVMGTFYGIKSVLPVMKKQGNGHIITISSDNGRRGTAMKSAYCATKFAQVGLMESLRMELKNSSIRTTIVFPGTTETEFFDAMENPGGHDIRLYGPVQKPENVAEAIVELIQNPSLEWMTTRGRLVTIAQAVSPGLVDWVVKNTIKGKQ